MESWLNYNLVMLKMVAESVIKENKPENKELIDIFLNGGNCVKELKRNYVKTLH